MQSEGLGQVYGAAAARSAGADQGAGKRERPLDERGDCAAFEGGAEA